MWSALQLYCINIFITDSQKEQFIALVFQMVQLRQYEKSKGVHAHPS